MRALVSLLLVLSLAASPLSLTLKGIGNDEDNLCVYTLYIRTGSIWKGGTDSAISLALAGDDGVGVQITNMTSWGGLMGPDHSYFQRGNLDIFSGRGPCLSSSSSSSPPPCYMRLTSDGSGDHHGWYCNYVEVTTTGPHMGCAQQKFTVEQWLATDAFPYELSAERNFCSARAARAGLAV